MVQVRQSLVAEHDGNIDIPLWLAGLGASLAGADDLHRACVVARDADSGRARCPSVQCEHNEEGQGETTVSTAFGTGLEMVHILRELKIEGDALVAAMLYRVVREGQLPITSVREAFGDQVEALIDGVQRMAVVSRVIHPEDQVVLGQQQSQADNVRRMLVNLIDDPRIALIKLAERCCAIRSVKGRPDKQKQVAREVFNIYAPLAHRLGIGHLKWELEDLAFRYLQPDDYRQVAALLDGRRLDRQAYIESVIKQFREQLERQQVQAEVFGRPKHIYSIWRKMQQKGIGFSEVYDVRAMRVLVDRIPDCYAALGVIHTLWPNISSEFDDYIANPKVNGYRSLHTAVYGPGGKVLEVQIRTHSMHEAAEIGVCAHWHYKGIDRGADAKDAYDEKLAWLRQLLAWHDEVGGQVDGGPQTERCETPERVYVFTPKGHVVDLPGGSTPVDFAYHIHTEVGHRCRGAKVNARIVPLNYRLQTGQQVEILAGSEAAPSRDWLRLNLGYVRSNRTRSSIQQWFRIQARDENLQMGRQLLEKEFKRLALTAIDFKALASRFQFGSVEDMYVAAGAGDLSPEQVIAAAQVLVEGDAALSEELSINTSARSVVADSGITVHGVGQLLTNLAGCCKPVPEDDIVGYITIGRGVTIHRSDCSKLLQLQSGEAQRLIEVAWGQGAASSYPAIILVEAFDRPGLLRDISALMAIEKVNVIAVQTGTDRNNMARMKMTCEVQGLASLSRLLARINQLSNVIEASRVQQE
jgi:GTP pyrophosphokinase